MSRGTATRGRSLIRPLIRMWLCCIIATIATPAGHCQTTISGRVWMPRSEGSTEMVPFRAIHVFGSLEGSGSQAAAFRTWETEPAGWYRISGSAGRYTLLYSAPAKAMRPIVFNNVYTRDGDEFDIHATPSFDYAVLDEDEWDPTPAREYYQTFVAKGRSITSVGIKLARDGIDGEGPGAQNLLVSIHRGSRSTPDTWEQIGPAVPILNVDCGGVKNYDYSAGWNSGEVATTPGETYAVRLRAESPTGKVQSYWRKRDSEGGCYRVAENDRGYAGRDLWMTVASDSDGLVIPYNKRVHREFVGETKFARKWTQTYVAQGRSLASVILYTATSGVQPGLPRQRVAVRVRRGGPGGPLVGTPKIAIGSGNFTGDASWGVFGCAWTPSEVELVPGQTYAVEFESIESVESLGGYVNIKGVKSDCIPGFHPYPKVPPDSYKPGRAYLNGTDPMDYDLDMQVVEYQVCPADWQSALDSRNLLRNGDMAAGETASEGDPGRPSFWRRFAIEPETECIYVGDANDGGNRILRVLGGGANGRKADGGFVQRVNGLKRADTYRLSGRVRSSWATDANHQCYIGLDPTGQDQDPNASTIVWGKPLPAIHSEWVAFEGEPIRPAGDAVSVWLRGRTTLTSDFPFKADFDDLSLRRVRTRPPVATSGTARP